MSDPARHDLVEALCAQAEHTALGYACKTNIEAAMGELMAKVAEVRAALASEAAIQVPADGWVLVPREPTPAMVEAWRNSVGSAILPNMTPEEADELCAFSDWQAMIAAAPDQEGPADGKCEELKP